MDQESKLRQEMLDEAQRKAARVLQRARREADKLLETVRTEAAQARDAHLAICEQQTEERCRAILASLEHEIRKQRLLRQETLLDQVLEAALERLEKLAGEPRRQLLDALLMRGHDTLGKTQIDILCAPQDTAIVEKLAARLAGADQPAPAVHPQADGGGGLVLVESGGRRRLDLTHATRLARRRDDLRGAAMAILSAPQTQEAQA